ncbi:hypothetical protein KP509_13G018900 [Ceratopteris richardii]|nr:hypothetical protein KP509_13G018900 [Ceratopteris richardii]
MCCLFNLSNSLPDIGGEPGRTTSPGTQVSSPPPLTVSSPSTLNNVVMGNLSSPPPTEPAPPSPPSTPSLSPPPRANEPPPPSPPIASPPALASPLPTTKAPNLGADTSNTVGKVTGIVLVSLAGILQGLIAAFLLFKRRQMVKDASRFKERLHPPVA